MDGWVKERKDGCLSFDESRLKCIGKKKLLFKLHVPHATFVSVKPVFGSNLAFATLQIMSSTETSCDPNNAASSVKPEADSTTNSENQSETSPVRYIAHTERITVKHDLTTVYNAGLNVSDHTISQRRRA